MDGININSKFQLELASHYYTRRLVFEKLKLDGESRERGANARGRCKTFVRQRGTRISWHVAKDCTDARIFMDNAPMLLSRDIKIYAHPRYGTLSSRENMVFVLNPLETVARYF